MAKQGVTVPAAILSRDKDRLLAPISYMDGKMLKALAGLILLLENQIIITDESNINF